MQCKRRRETWQSRDSPSSANAISLISRSNGWSERLWSYLSRFGLEGPSVLSTSPLCRRVTMGCRLSPLIMQTRVVQSFVRCSSSPIAFF